MTLIEKTLSHCLWISELDENYARKAAKWYGLMLEDSTLLERFEAELAKRKAALPLSGTSSSGRQE